MKENNFLNLNFKFFFVTPYLIWLSFIIFYIFNSELIKAGELDGFIKYGNDSSTYLTYAKQLTNFDLNMTYQPIRDFFKLCKEYVEEDRRIEINIPFPEINRSIRGLLAISVREECWINLKHEK